MGRPTKYRPKYCEQIIEFMAEGKSKEAFAGHIGVSRRRIPDWSKKHKEFGRAVEIGTAKSQNFWEELGIQMALSGQGNVTAWIFNMKNRFGWRDKHDVTSDDKPIVAGFNYLPPDEDHAHNKT